MILLCFFGKGYLLSIAPGYETLGLNADGVGSRETTMLTTLVATQQTFLVSDSYVTTLRLDWRKEDSKLENVGTFDATKIILGSQNIWFKDSKKTEAFLFNFTLTDNQSPADDNAFGKSEVALGYLMPVWSKTQWTNMLTGSVSDYPRSPLGRKDSNVNFNSSLSSPFNETLTGLFSLGLETNTSTIEAATYNKYTLMATLSWTTDF